MASLLVDEHNTLFDELVNCGWTHDGKITGTRSGSGDGWFFLPPSFPISGRTHGATHPHVHIFLADSGRKGGFPSGSENQIDGGRDGKNVTQLNADISKLREWLRQVGSNNNYHDGILCLIAKWRESILKLDGNFQATTQEMKYVTNQQDRQAQQEAQNQAAAVAKNKRREENEEALRKQNKKRGNAFLTLPTGDEKLAGDAGSVNKYRLNAQTINDLLERNHKRRKDGNASVFDNNQITRLEKMSLARHDQLNQFNKNKSDAHREQLGKIEIRKKEELEREERMRELANNAQAAANNMTVQDALNGITDRQLDKYFKELVKWANIEDFSTVAHKNLETFLTKKLSKFNQILLKKWGAMPHQFKNINALIIEIIARMGQIQWNNKKNTIVAAKSRKASGTEEGVGDELIEFVGNLQNEIDKLIKAIKPELTRRNIAHGGRRTRRRRKHKKRRTIKKSHKKKKHKKKRTIKKRHKTKKHRRTRKH